MDNTFLDLYNEFLTYVNKDDEAGARKFLTDNFKKFPQEVQDKLTFAFFEEALTNETEGMEEISELQKEGLEALSQIDKVKKIIADKLKIKDLKSKLSQ